MNDAERADCNQPVEKVNAANADDAALIAALEKVATEVAVAVRVKPIFRPRPNEVGNDLEPFVLAACQKVGLKAELPTSASGRTQRNGYPDILVWDAAQRPTYLEVKSFADGAPFTNFRAFYMSPSANPKVCRPARHLVLGFGVVSQPHGAKSAYEAVSYKLLDLHDMQCDVKYEFNADNKRMYAKGLVLASGKV